MNNQSEYDFIIIGAGIGGLSVGNILAKQGKKVLILEKNHAVGGAVSTFYRNGYPIDISHALCALGEGGFIRKMFEYLEIYDKLEFKELEKAFIYIPDFPTCHGRVEQDGVGAKHESGCSDPIFC